MTASSPAARTARLRPLTLALALALGLGSGAARAQSLKELYDAAIAYDATYLAAKAQAESTPYRIAQSGALNRPSVGLTGSGTHSQIDPPTRTVNGVRVSGDRVSSTTWQAGANARMPLINTGNAATIRQAQASAGLTEAELEAARQDLIVRLAQAYFDVLAAQDTLNTAQASKKAIGEQLASAKRNFEVGTATITDTREAQARFDLATAQEIAADNDLRTKRIALDQVVGRAGVVPLALAVPARMPSLSPTDAESWVANAEEASPAIRRAKVGLDVAKIETEKARASDDLTLDLVGNAGLSRASGSATASPGNTLSATVGVQLAMPLYTGGLTQNRLKETLALEEKARNDVEGARRGVAQATRQAFFGVQSLQAQVTALEAAESSSKLALEATQLGYKVGVRVNLDVLNAQSQLFTTQRDLAKARYDTIVNSLRLRQASGTLAPEHLEAVDGLLKR
jgi:outer membrane protein